MSGRAYYRDIMQAIMPSNDTRGDANENVQRGISTGTNARPLDDTIAQAAPGIPDDSASPVRITREEAKAMSENLLCNAREGRQK